MRKKFDVKRQGKDAALSGALGFIREQLGAMKLDELKETQSAVQVIASTVETTHEYICVMR